VPSDYFDSAKPSAANTIEQAEGGPEKEARAAGALSEKVGRKYKSRGPSIGSATENRTVTNYDQDEFDEVSGPPSMPVTDTVTDRANADKVEAQEAEIEDRGASNDDGGDDDDGEEAYSEEFEEGPSAARTESQAFA